MLMEREQKVPVRTYTKGQLCRLYDCHADTLAARLQGVADVLEWKKRRVFFPSEVSMIFALLGTPAVETDKLIEILQKKAA